MNERATPAHPIVKGLPMLVPESIVQQAAEKNRVKKGILGGSEERFVFGKTLYLPYLEFTYQYSTEKGLLSKRNVLAQGRSVVIALREVNLGFYPELISLLPQLVDIEPDSGSLLRGVDSTTLVSERLDEAKRMLSEFDHQLQELSRRYDSLAKTEGGKLDIKENIHHLRNTRETRWKMFADGLKLPVNTNLEKLELLEGSLFYIPYFITKFTRGGESRFLVWNKEGKPSESIADELMKNRKFRELVQSSVTMEDPVNRETGSS